MTPRSKKYYQKRKGSDGEKKGSVSEAGYNEQHEVTHQQAPKRNPAPPESEDDPKTDTIPAQSSPSEKSGEK